MKKIVLLLTLLLVLSLAACGEPAETTTPDSSKNNPTTTVPTSAPHIHSFGDWSINLTPTCATPGEEIRICACGAQEKQTIDALGHNYMETERTEPTPSAPNGNVVYTCATCADSYAQEMVMEGSEGLDYVVLTLDMWDSPNNNGMMCRVVSIGSCTDTILTIPKYIDGYKVVSIGKQAFYDNDTITSVILPDSILFIEESAFENCGKLQSASLQKGILTIGDRAFHWCLQLTDITIPETVQAIGDTAFRGCNFTSLVIPDSVIYIASDAFDGCSNMVSVTLSKNLTVISDSMFEVCHSLTSIEIPDGVTEIGSHAFYYCDELVSVTIPASVTNIADGAFYKCSKLKEIHFLGTMEQWNAIEKNDGDWAGWPWDDYTGYYTVYCTDGEIKK